MVARGKYLRGIREEECTGDDDEGHCERLGRWPGVGSVSGCIVVWLPRCGLSFLIKLPDPYQVCLHCRSALRHGCHSWAESQRGEMPPLQRGDTGACRRGRRDRGPRFPGAMPGQGRLGSSHLLGQEARFPASFVSLWCLLGNTALRPCLSALCSSQASCTSRICALEQEGPLVMAGRACS